MKNFYNKGITLIEIAVIIGIFVVVVAVVMPQFYGIRENQVLKNGVADIISAINKARSQTISSLNSSSYGVYFDSSSVTIFKGISFVVGDSNNETISMVTPASIANVTLSGASGSSGEFYFSRIYGVPSKYGTVTISTTNYSKVINISATGVAN